MASSSSSYLSTSNQYVVYWLEVIETGQNIANNYTTIAFRVWAKRTNSGYTTWGPGTVNWSINGNSYSYNGDLTITSTSTVILSDTSTIYHNTDGTKTIYCAASVNIPGANLSSSMQGYNTSLTTIPRTSTFTLSTYNMDAGGTFTVNISRASSSFTHEVGFYFGNHVVNIGSGVGTSTSYTVPLSFLDAIPTAVSGVARVVMDTWSGSTKIGTVSANMTINVPANVNPSFTSMSVTRVDNGVPAAWGLYVKGKSKVKLAINGAKSLYGASIIRYNITGGGYSANSSALDTGVLLQDGDVIFTGTVTDSRNRTFSSSTSIKVQDYFPPRISYTESLRCNSAGVVDENGTYIKLRSSWEVASVGGKNTNSCKARWAPKDSGIYSGYVTLTNNTFTAAQGGGGISLDKSYSIEYTVTDAFGTNTIYDTVPTPAVTLDFKKGGKGVAVGKVSETDNLFDVAWSTSVAKDFSVNGRTMLMGMADVQGFFSAYSGANFTQDVNFYKKVEVDGVLNSKTNLTVGGSAVVSHGSNGNGEFIKFYNGIMICWQNIYLNISIDRPYGVLYSALWTWTYAQNFTSTPSVSVGQFKWGTGASWGAAASITNAFADIRGLDAFARPSDGCSISVMAIGKWK